MARRTVRSVQWSLRMVVVGCIALASVASCSTDRSQRAASVTTKAEAVDLTTELESLDATFVVRDVASGRTRVHNLALAETGFTPASTFKIPNSIIGLECGILTGADFVIAWDPAFGPAKEWWPASWQGDQTLRSAFRNSIVWYYRELARRIGEERMQRWIDRLDYGNRSIDGGIDRFWLDGAIRISAMEQVEFLERFVTDDLPISKATTATMREIMLLEETPAYRLSGKTGTFAPDPDAPSQMQLGWLVGFVERDGRTTVFAMNISSERVWEDYPPARRAELVRRSLRALDILPPAT